MFLYSIPNLHKAVKTLDYYKEKRPSEKPVLIDKCNWLIHSIVQGNRHNYNLLDYEPIPLSKTILKAVIGRTEYLKVIKILEELGYITIDHKYLPKKVLKENDKRKPFSKKYSLSDKALNEGVIKIGILSKRMEKKIQLYRIEKIKKYNRDKNVHSKILDSLTKLHFNPENNKALQALNAYEEDIDKDEFYKQAYEELKESNNLNTIDEYANSDFFYYNQSSKVNRVFHYYSTIPKPYRESLSLKSGERLSEIDLKNSQPLIIALNYLNKKTAHTQSDKELLEAVLNGKLYENVAKQALKNGDSETYNLFTENYSKFKAKVLGKGLYFNYIPDLDKLEPMENYLIQLYPEFMLYIRSKKLNNCRSIGYKEGFKIVAQEAQTIESSIFIEGFFNRLELGNFAVPVHDSVLIKTDEVNHYLEILIDVFSEKFPFLSLDKIKNLFRITHQ